MDIKFGAADEIHKEFPTVSPFAPNLASQEDGLEDLGLDDDPVASSATIDLYRTLSRDQQSAFRKLETGLSFHSSISPEYSQLLAILPREAVEAVVLDLLPAGDDRYMEIITTALGGSENVIKTGLGRHLALNGIADFYLHEDFTKHQSIEWLKILANISNEEAREVVVKDYVSLYSYNPPETMLQTMPHMAGEKILELKISEDELSSEASKQALAVLSDPHIKPQHALDLAASIRLSPEAMSKIVSTLELGDLKPIEFVKYLGSRLEQDMPALYQHHMANIMSNLKLDKDLADYFIESIDAFGGQAWLKDAVFKAVSFKSVANKLNYKIEYEGWTVPWLDELKKITQYDLYEASEDHFRHGTETFAARKPSQDHPNSYTVAQKKLAASIFQTLQGKQLDHSTSSEHELDPADATLANAFNINHAIDFTLRTMSVGLKNTRVPDIDITFLESGDYEDIKLKPFTVAVKRLVARYLAQTATDDNEWNRPLSDNRQTEIDRLLNEGMNKWYDAYDTDIPLYDKLYEEFDEMRRNDDEISEIYLGRDGIYAYLGRRATSFVRNQSSDQSDNAPIKLNYLVYPRHFRDYLTLDTKQKYLEYEGISEQTNPHFYDTGFTGTIPEDIMRIMGFGDEEINSRIHLLSATHDSRRVKGVSQNARNEIIERIEGNVKLEESANGLARDPETGRIERIAVPTSPREQFLYLFLRQAFLRHYYLKEKMAQKTGRQRELQTA